MRFLNQVITICWKDLKSEFRTKEALNASFAFSVMILLMFSFAFDPDAEETRNIAGGLLWMAFAFAGALILNRSFARELVNDCLDALIFSPVSGARLFLGKALASFVLLMTVELVSLPVFGIFYNVSWLPQFPAILGVMILATWGMTVIGTIFSALTVNLRLRELMLPMLVYPMMVPALMSAMYLTSVLLAGKPFTDGEYLWVRLLFGFDIIFTALALLTVEAVLVN